jgi:hypothetical protein
VRRVTHARMVGIGMTMFVMLHATTGVAGSFKGIKKLQKAISKAKSAVQQVQKEKQKVSESLDSIIVVVDSTAEALTAVADSTMALLSEVEPATAVAQADSAGTDTLLAATRLAEAAATDPEAEKRDGEEKSAGNMDGLFESYGKPAVEALVSAKRLASSLREKPEVATFEKARRDLAEALRRLLEMKRWTNAANSRTVREISELYYVTFNEVHVAVEPLLLTTLTAAVPPKDLYAGNDKQKIADAILVEWKRMYPEDHVLMVRFPMQRPVRTQERVWHEAKRAWTYVDTSALLINVIVKTTEKIATKYPAYINIDNVSGIVSYGTNTKIGGYVVEQLLIANLR